MARHRFGASKCHERGVGTVTNDDWRSRKKAATRRSIQEHALRLFAANGYTNTTVEDIAAAAGVSHMTFFRHFPRKENVIQTREYDPMIEELIVGRPPYESPLAAIHAALSSSFSTIMKTDRERILTRVRLMMSTPELRALQLVVMDETRDLFVRSLARRNPQNQQSLVVAVHARIAVAVFVAALETWAQTDDGDLPACLDAAFSAAETATAPPCLDAAPSPLPRSRQRAAERQRRSG
jgi:AcrR family transcriptional regulator